VIERDSHSDEEPGMHLRLSGNAEYRATRDDTSLFTFLGRTAFNHIFIHTGSEDNVMIGAYVFHCHPAYEAMSEYMFANDYPMHLNLPEVAPCDQLAWETMVHEQVEDTDYLPSDWLE